MDITEEQNKIHPASPEQDLRTRMAAQSAQLLDSENMAWSEMDGDLLSFDPNFRFMADYFGIDSKHYEESKGKLETIYAWATQQFGVKKGILGALEAIKGLERRVGKDPFTPRLSRVYQWAALDQKKSEIKQMQKTLED